MRCVPAGAGVSWVAAFVSVADFSPLFPSPSSGLVSVVSGFGASFGGSTVAAGFDRAAVGARRRALRTDVVLEDVRRFTGFLTGGVSSVALAAVVSGGLTSSGGRGIVAPTEDN